MCGADRQHTTRCSLSRDHPEGLRERAGHDLRFARRQQLGKLLVIKAPGEDHALPEQRGALHVALTSLAVQTIEEREQVAQRIAAWPLVARRRREVLQRPSRERNRARGVEVAGPERRQQRLQHRPIRAEADDDQPRTRLGP